MVRKRSKKGTLQERVNEMWPTAVQQALAEEKRGEVIPEARQIYLMAMIVGALEDRREAELPEIQDAWIDIRVIDGKLRAFRMNPAGGGQFVGNVGKGQ